MNGTRRRVLMLTHQCAGRGGSFMRAVSLARALARMGFEMTVLASRAQAGLLPRFSDWYGVRLVELPDMFAWRVRNGGLSPLDLIGRLIYSRGSFDLIHGFDHRPCVSLPALWRSDKRVPFVSDWADLWGKGGLSAYRLGLRGGLLARFDTWLETYVRRHCNAVTAISHDLSQRAIRIGVPEDHVRVVPAGANYDLVVPMDKAEARRRQGIPEGAELLVCAGFSSLDAGLMVEAFLELRKIRPAVRLLMAGGEIPEFEAAMRAAGEQGGILHVGMQPYEKLGEVLACGEVMWLPYGESPVDIARFPNRFGEYIAAGRPIATNRGGDHAAIVEREGIGIATTSDARVSAVGIAALLDDAPRREQMGRRARALAEGTYSWQALASCVAELYEELLQ